MTSPAPQQRTALMTMLRDVIDRNRYMTLGTVEPNGMPRVSPVYFTHHEYRVFYWVSSPGAQHSQNVARQPDVTAVIFDSRLAPSDTEAVYLNATAHRVPDDELAAECAVAFRAVCDDAKAFAPADLTDAAPLRLYRAIATSYAVHIPGSHPAFGRGTDTRVPVVLT